MSVVQRPFPPAPEAVPTGVAAWRGPGLALALAGICLAVAFFDTFRSMVEIWIRSETFAHGFLIAPLSLFLVWRNREYIFAHAPRVELVGVVGIAIAGFGWLLASVVDVAVVQQLAVVSMIPFICWTLLGRKVVWAMAFPLAYLFFSVPVGEGLVQPMMEFTALFLVKALQLTGVPVYREGMFLAVPSGNWSVVEGCSGVRYLIASTALGCLYAYITYSSKWRRGLFILASIVAPIIANGLRAYIIVMIGHLSGMKYATGVDHLIYGWVFFGLVMLLLFWLGGYWREDEPVRTPPESKSETVASRRSAWSGALAAVVAVAIWPMWSHAIQSKDDVAVTLAAPGPADGWVITGKPFTEWQPQFKNATAERAVTYRRATDRVGLHLFYYASQRDGAELINSQNVMIGQKHPIWHERYRRVRAVDLPELDTPVIESWIRSRQEGWLAWYWFWIDGHFTSNRYEAKLREAWAKLSRGRSAGAGVIVYTPVGEDKDEARARLASFIRGMLPSVSGALGSASGPPTGR